MSYLNETERKEVEDVYKAIEEIDNIQKDPNINKIFFKKYKAIKKIADGSFGSIYQGINIVSQKPVAIKLEDRSQFNLLEEEAYNLFNLRGFGIVEIISFGKNNKYNIMIQSLLGDSLYKIFLDCKKKFTLKDVCLIGLQCLDRIEWVHTKNIIHRDIKPENFLIGLKDPRILYLIDFGLSKKYRSERTMKHIQFTLTKKLTGTARYASINALKGFELSRRDDLESFCYMIIFFILKKLPWQGIKAQTQAKRYKKNCELKEMFNIDEYKKTIPIEIITIFKYVKKLKFDEEPNYDKIRNLFNNFLNKIFYNKNDTFSWIKDKRILILKKSSDVHRRKSSFKKRLLDNIINNQKSIDANYNSSRIFIKFNENIKNIYKPNKSNVLSEITNYNENYGNINYEDNDFINSNKKRDNNNNVGCSSRKSFLDYNMDIATKSMDIDDNKKKYLERIKKKNEKIQNIDTTKNILNTDIKKYTIKKIKIDQIKNIKNNNIKINKINNIKINNINNNNKNNLLNQYNILTTETRDTSKTLNIVKLKEYSPKYAINKSFNNSNMKNKLPNNKFNLYKTK